MATLEEKKQYEILKIKELEINKSCETLKSRLEGLSLQIIDLQNQQTDVVRRLSDKRGGEKWIELKAELARLAMRGAARGFVAPVLVAEAPKKKWYEVWR